MAGVLPADTLLALVATEEPVLGAGYAEARAAERLQDLGETGEGWRSLPEAVGGAESAEEPLEDRQLGCRSRRRTA